MGLKVFRAIPKDLVEWERWCNDQDLGGTTIIQEIAETVEEISLVNYFVKHAVAVISANAYTFVFEVAQSWEIDLENATGNVTLTLQGGPDAGFYGEMNIRVRQDSTARTITWAGGTFLWTNASQPTQSADNNAVDIYHFQSVDQGNTWTASVLQDVG